jgi:hypothetical protein
MLQNCAGEVTVETMLSPHRVVMPGLDPGIHALKGRLRAVPVEWRGLRAVILFRM